MRERRADEGMGGTDGKAAAAAAAGACPPVRRPWQTPVLRVLDLRQAQVKGGGIDDCGCFDYS